jgi:CHAT domain-containing protein
MFRFKLKINFMLLALAAAAMAQTGASPVVDDTTLANQYFAKAEKWAKESKFDSAIFHYENASLIYEKLAAQRNTAGLWERHIKSYNNIGDMFRRKNELERARFYLNKAIATGTKQLGENHLEVAQSFHNLGNVYVTEFELEKALENFNRALSARIRLLGDNHLEVAKSYNNIGVVYKEKYDYENALIYFNKSLALKYKLQGENTIDIARTYNNIGDLYRLQGDFDMALEFAKKSAALKLKLLPANHAEIGSAYLNLGNVYLEQNNLEMALENYQKALENAERVYGENSLPVAATCGNIGLALQQQGDYGQAVANYQRALTILIKAYGENHLEVARNYYNTGELYLLKRDYAKALIYLSDALSIRRQTLGEPHPLMSQVYRKMAEAYFGQNNFERAVVAAHKAILSVTPAFTDTNIYANPPLQNISSEVELLPALAQKALNLERLFSLKSHDRKDLQMSLTTYQLAADLIDKMRRDHRAEGSKLFLGERALAIYENAIRAAALSYKLAKDIKYQKQAFAFAEKSKATVLSQLLQESQAKQFAGIPADLLEKERDLKINLGFYETEMEKQKTGKPDKAKLRRYEDRYFALKREREKLNERLEKSYPQYYALKYKSSIAAIAELQESLDGQTAMVEYFSGEYTIFAFAVTRDGFDMVAIEKDSSFEARADSLIASFKNVAAKDAYLQNAAHLYQMLVQPLASRITNKTKWVIIPDGDLHQIPFEALLAETAPPQSAADYRTLPYLIKQREISYHYSATLFLKSLREPAAVSHANLFGGFAPVFGETVKNGKLFHFEYPEFTVARPDAHRYLVTRDGKTLEELKYSEKELHDILAVLFNRGRNYLYQEASEENFKKQIKGYKYVHVATHGFINSENPKLSNLAFSQPQDNNAREDGILFSGETYNLDLNADLLVLSACQTGVGKLAKGEGLMALTRGFLYSGARNIIASLWKVYDQHTSLLMVDMYRQIAAGKSYSAALREAKLKMIANSETAWPQSWAGFVLIGK